MKKSWMLFLMVFLTGAVNMVEAVRGHRACIEQREHEPRNYVMSAEDEKSCRIIEDAAFRCCCLMPRYRTRHLASLQETIKVGDNLRYLNSSHGIDGFSSIERHYTLPTYEYWKIVGIDIQKKRFTEFFVKDRCLTRHERNTEAI